MRKNILITGAKGQLGSEIRELAGEYKKLNFFFTDLAELDISDKKKVFDYISGNEIDIIINCAAYTAVDKAEDEPELAEKINVTAVQNLAESAKKTNSAFIHISTDYVFDGTNHKPYVEIDKVNPIGIYGKTKLAGEKEALKLDIEAIVIRTSWLYSSFGNNFVKTMLRLGSEKESLNVVFDQIGTPTYARDLAKGILEIVNSGEKLNKSHSIYHYSNEGVASWYDFATEIMEIANLNCSVFPIETKDFPTKAERPHYSVLNNKAIKDDFGIKISHWKKTLIDCIKVFKK